MAGDMRVVANWHMHTGKLMIEAKGGLFVVFGRDGTIFRRFDNLDDAIEWAKKREEGL
jgi:hypothetical protein